MDRQLDEAQVLSTERGAEDRGILLVVNPWRVRELELTQEKINFLWGRIKAFRTLFSDFTKNRFERFIEVLNDPASYWLEITDSTGTSIGLFYVTRLDQIIDAEVHVIFFDRQLTNKVEITKLILFHVFQQFVGLHRLTVTVPAIYHATIRFAKSVGFKHEGRMRERFLFGGKWVDEVVMGLLASEVVNGTD